LTILLDGLSIDDASAPILRDGLLAQCPGPPAASIVAQKSSGAINPTTGQPVAGGGNMLAMNGGPYGQDLLRYLEKSGISPLYQYYDATLTRFYGRGGGADAGSDAGPDRIIVEELQSALNDSHGYFIMEMIVDPDSGTLVFSDYGLDAVGTIAGTWYFVNKVLPNLATFGKSWYVYKWTDQDADKMPSDPDQFSLIASAP
jgi:hypothetical protein